MTGSGGGRSDGRDKPGGAPGPDATQLVFRNEKNEHSDDATVILDPRYRPVEPDSSPHNAGGTIIGDVRDAQKGVRLPGQQGGQHGGQHQAAPQYAQGAPSPASAGGHTVYLPSQLKNADDAPSFDPVVGWLVVKAGPGRGQCCLIHYGQNSIGRGNSQRISLDFGDERISRDAHAFIIFDDKQRKFYIRDNGKSNLVRHNGGVVMMPTELKQGDEIAIGETTLLFVPLCGPDFDWSSKDDTPGT